MNTTTPTTARVVILRVDFFGDHPGNSSRSRAAAYADAWRDAVQCKAPKELRQILRIKMRSWAQDAVNCARTYAQQKAIRRASYAA